MKNPRMALPAPLYAGSAVIISLASVAQPPKRAGLGRTPRWEAGPP